MPRYSVPVVPPAIAERFASATVQADERCNCDSCGDPLEVGAAVYVDPRAETVHCPACVGELARHVERGGKLQGAV